MKEEDQGNPVVKLELEEVNEDKGVVLVRIANIRRIIEEVKQEGPEGDQREVRQVQEEKDVGIEVLEGQQEEEQGISVTKFSFFFLN